MTTRIVRLSALAIGLFVAAPALASVSPLCGDENHGKDKADNKEKTEKKEKQDEKKKPQNPA
jgi:H+/gluconate symporter-like permease